MLTHEYARTSCQRSSEGDRKLNGTLVDEEIRERASRGELIERGFDPDRIKQACYELRASRTYYDLGEPERAITVAEGEGILLKPKQILVFITEESLRLSDSVLGRVLSKGQMFSLGLVPVNTYADPGFEGRLGIVMINASNDYLSIPPLTPIAKIEFVQLPRKVDRPYHGQHGFETEIWPIPTKFKLTREQIRADPRIGSPVDEVAREYGPDFGTIARRVLGYERKLLIASIVYFFVLIGVLALSSLWQDRLNIWLSVSLGVLGNLIFTFLTLFATNTRRRR